MTSFLWTTIQCFILYCGALCYGCYASSYLTPYIRQGDVAAARNLSVIEPTQNARTQSYAGFITVNESLGNHLFFWFFPALNSDPKSPLVVWLNGGPGEPSMLGLFYENGPMRLYVDANGTLNIKKWTKSWAETFSMLYIDNLVGVGYSHSDKGVDGLRTSQEGYTEDLYEFIQQFYTMFPEYLDRELYIGGQSYAGKYVTLLAYKLHKMTPGVKNNITLTGIYLGAPFLEPYSQSRAMGEYFYSSGAISYKQFRDYQLQVDAIFYRLHMRQMTADEAMYMLLLNSSVAHLMADNYSNRLSPPYSELQLLMNLPKMKEMIHAGNLTFRVWDDDLRAMYNQDRTRGVSRELAVLLDKYKVLIYNGDLDAVVTSAMIEAALSSTKWSLRYLYLDSPREVWMDDYQLKGFYTRTGHLCRVVIHGAGHYAPHDQPDTSLDMMSQFIKNGCVHS